jgi:isoleucyl-tRNA synthetase
MLLSNETGQPHPFVGAGAERSVLTDEDMNLLRQELNVKEIVLTDDLGSLGERYAQVDARKVGPRMGKRVQEVIQAGKRGEFEVEADGSIRILEEVLSPDEAEILYRGAEGSEVVADAGVVVAVDTNVSEELELEGLARDLIRAIQKLRKEQGYNLGEKVSIGLNEAAAPILAMHQALIEQETSVVIDAVDGAAHDVEVGETQIRIFMNPKS